MTLTKTEFKEFLICDKCLWLKKKKPELYTHGEFSLFLEKLIRDGYVVESYVQTLFLGGIPLSGSSEDLIENTKKLVEQKITIFQATFETERGLYARIDALVFNTETEKWDIYEVKASSEVKTDLQHNHIKDVTFQTIVAEESGLPVGSSFIVHVNKEYVRSGDIDAEKLLVKVDVTAEVEAVRKTVQFEILEALDLLSRDNVSLEGCGCMYRSSGQRCDCFFTLNPHVPEYSVHNIVSGKKLQSLIDMDILAITDIPDDFDLTDIQREKVLVQKSVEGLVDEDAISNILSDFNYPLYFLDYETYASPIPLLDGYKPNQQLVFQVSIHKLEKDGTLSHFEYLAEDVGSATAGIVKTLNESIGPIGTILVWYESFEKGRNEELAELHPEDAAFLLSLNDRIYDLMKVFKKDYLHPAFNGSASIKNVLPILLPDLTYKNLAVQNGTMALSEWEKFIKGEVALSDLEQTKKDLLAYCERDTFAMVEIYRKLKEISKS
jgi:hypothetical protein